MISPLLTQPVELDTLDAIQAHYQEAVKGISKDSTLAEKKEFLRVAAECSIAERKVFSGGDYY